MAVVNAAVCDDDGAMAIPRGRQILVVEDDKSLRKLLADILEAEGYQVRQAGNGKEAMALLRGAGEPPDLIVLDLMLPKMNGWDLRAALSEDERRAGPTRSSSAAS